ncbi:MAG TPA: pyridoxamine 5'-phosphate oxidase family protein [Polyangiaceae bacterium]|nr:pyridoxamine 5'-phosphate oxidase family protein [Polyangiaceae bacterium]
MSSPPPPPYTPTERTRVRRLSQRGTYDRGVVHAILDEALVCHLGFVREGQPFVIPTVHVRVDECLYVHGARANAALTAIASGEPVCITVTLLDGLVLARSAFHHSMNYRSVVVLGVAREIHEETAKRQVLDALVERVGSGRAAKVRAASPAELRATRLFGLDLAEVSAKVRSGPPSDDAEDLILPCWAGVIPLALTRGEPIRHQP